MSVRAVQLAPTENVNVQSGTTYTVLDTDRGKLITFNNAAAVAVTLPQAGAAGLFVAGWVADFQNTGAGSVTITPTTSTIDVAATLVLVTNQGARVCSTGSNYNTARTGTPGILSHTQAEVDTSYGYFTPATGGTVVMTSGMGRAIINPAGTLATLTITLPPSPVNGQIARGASTQIVTALTMNTSDGSVIVGGLTSLAVDGTFAFLYRAATTSWYPGS